MRDDGFTLFNKKSAVRAETTPLDDNIDHLLYKGTLGLLFSPIPRRCMHASECCNGNEAGWYSWHYFPLSLDLPFRLIVLMCFRHVRVCRFSP